MPSQAEVNKKIREMMKADAEARAAAKAAETARQVAFKAAGPKQQAKLLADAARVSAEKATATKATSDAAKAAVKAAKSAARGAAVGAAAGATAINTPTELIQLLSGGGVKSIKTDRLSEGLRKQIATGLAKARNMTDAAALAKLARGKTIGVTTLMDVVPFLVGGAGTAGRLGALGTAGLVAGGGLLGAQMLGSLLQQWGVIKSPEDRAADLELKGRRQDMAANALLMRQDATEQRNARIDKTLDEAVAELRMAEMANAAGDVQTMGRFGGMTVDPQASAAQTAGMTRQVLPDTSTETSLLMQAGLF